jgi:HD-like signal output (HDOD) protein
MELTRESIAVLKWFRRLSSSSAVAGPPAPPAALNPAAPASAGQPRCAPAPVSQGDAVHPLSQADVDFLEALIAPRLLRHMEDFPKPDQIFLGGISKRLRMRTLEMPVLPDVALRLAAMLRQDSRPIADYIALLNQDTLLSVEVLKAANSAAFAALPTTSLREAVMRIGLSRVQSILMLAHLNSRILKGGAAQRQAELLLDLALSIAVLAGRLLPTDGAADLRFMRGMLLHVEHMVILGTIGDVSRERQVVITPSVAALQQAFWRYGPQIRDALTAAWKLDHMLDGDVVTGHEAYLQLRHAVVSRWLGRDLPAVDGVNPALLTATAEGIPARVAPHGESEAIGPRDRATSAGPA